MTLSTTLSWPLKRRHWQTSSSSSPSPDEDSLPNEAERWTIQTNGSSAQKREGVGVVIITPNGEMLKYRVQLKFSATNNEAEYEGILAGLRVRKALGAKNLLLQSDSKLVIG